MPSFLGRLLGGALRMGMQAAQNIPEETMEEIQNIGGEIAGKVKAKAKDAFMQKGREYFGTKSSSTSTEDISLEILDAWFKEIYLHQDKIITNLNAEIIQAKNAGKNELVKLYVDIQGSLPILSDLYANFLKDNDSAFTKFDTKSISPVLLNYLSAIKMQLTKELDKTAVSYWHLAETKDSDYIQKKKEELVSSVSKSLYKKFKAFQLDVINPEKNKNLRAILHDAIPDLTNTNYNNELVKAARDKSDPTANNLKKYIGLLADVNGIGKNGRTPLQEAVLANNFEQAKILLEHGADPNAVIHSKDKMGWSPIHVAAFDNNERLLKLLIKHGALVNVQIDDTAANKFVGHTPLTLALLNPVHQSDFNAEQQYKTVKTLCENNADVNQSSFSKNVGYITLQQDNWSAWTPLAIATHNWNRKIPDKYQIQIIDELLSKGADPSLKMKGNSDRWGGNSPIDLIVENKHDLPEDTVIKLQDKFISAIDGTFTINDTKNLNAQKTGLGSHRAGFFQPKTSEPENQAELDEANRPKPKSGLTK